MAATNFSDGLGHTLAPGTVSGVTSACVGGNSCTAATNSITYPITLSATAAKFFNAAAASGMGDINVTPSMNVLIPGNAYAGTYTSTLPWQRSPARNALSRPSCLTKGPATSGAFPWSRRVSYRFPLRMLHGTSIVQVSCAARS